MRCPECGGRLEAVIKKEEILYCRDEYECEKEETVYTLLGFFCPACTFEAEVKEEEMYDCMDWELIEERAKEIQKRATGV